MKILWMSDSPTTPTGFGTVTRNVCAGLADYGHQVSILGWQTHSQERWYKCTLYPFHLQHQPTINKLLGYLRRLQPDVFVMLADLWVFPSFHHPLIANFVHTAGIARALYYPINREPSEGRLPQEWIDLLKTVELPIAMSHYGAEVSQANGVRAASIPPGVDTRLFHPPARKALAKQALGYDGRFVILTDVRPHARYHLQKPVHPAWEIFTLETFRRFAEGKDDVLLHVHCDPDDPQTHASGYCSDLQAEIADLNLTSKVRLTADLYQSGGLALTQEEQLYQAADVHLLAAAGEGLGLPTLQAAAVGAVPLAADYAASREQVLPHGEAIQVQRFRPDQFGLRRAFIDIDDAVSRLERLYRDRARLSTKALQAYSFAKGYDWQCIVPFWHNLLEGQVLPGIKYPWQRRGTLVGTRELEPAHS